MLYIEAEIKLYDTPTFTVAADNTVKMEIKGSCAGGSINLYSSDVNMIYYAMSYCVKGCVMQVEGNLILFVIHNKGA